MNPKKKRRRKNVAQTAVMNFKENMNENDRRKVNQLVKDIRILILLKDLRSELIAKALNILADYYTAQLESEQGLE